MKKNTIKQNGLFFLVIIAYRNIFRNIRRSILCIIAIAMSVFFMITMMSWMEGMIDALYADIQTYETGHIQIISKEFANKQQFLPLQYPLEIQNQSMDDIINELKKNPEIKKIFPRIITYATIKDSTVKNAVIWGINIEEEMKYNYFNKKTKNLNNCLKEGRLPDDKNECILGWRLAKKMNLTLGDKITLKIVSSQYSDKFYITKIVGVFDFDYGEIDKNYIIIPFEKLQKLATLNDKTQSLIIYLKNPIQAPVIQKKLNKYFNDQNIVIKKWEDNYWVTYIKQSNTIMLIIYGLFIIVASFLIINTIIMVIHERIKEIGMMGALGMKRIEIVFVFFIEAAFLSLFGSIIGTITGGLTSFIGSLFPIDVRIFTGESFAMSNTIFFKVSIIIILGGFLYGLLVSTVCTIFPSLKAAFVEPVEALRR